MDKAELILAILKLAEDLEPAALNLVHNLAQDLTGLSADQVYDQALTKFQAIHEKAVAASGAASSPS